MQWGQKQQKQKPLQIPLQCFAISVHVCVLCVCSRQVLRVVQLIRKRPYKCWPLMRNTNGKVMCKDSAQQESYKPYHSDGYNCTVDINTCGINRVCVCARTHTHHWVWLLFCFECMYSPLTWLKASWLPFISVNVKFALVSLQPE